MVRKYTAQRPMEVIPAGAKAWPEMMTRESGAMAGFGETAMSVGQKWQEERDNLEIGKDISNLNNYQFTLMRQLEEDWKAKKFTDPKQFEQVEEDYTKAREKFLNGLLKGKRGIISDRVRSYADDKQVKQAKEFYSSLFAKEKEFNSVEGLKIVESAIQRNDRDEALMQIDEFSYWFGPTKTKYLRDTLDKRLIETQHQNFLEQATVYARGLSYEEAIKYINEIPRTAITETERNGLIAQRERQERGVEIQREKERDEISKAIRGGGNAINLIENSNLDESEQWVWAERARAETERIAKGQEIITDNRVRTELYNDIMGILTLTKTKKEVLEKAKATRFDPEKPTLDETDYSKIETAIHAQYEQAYGQVISKVSRHAEGLLLNPDSLGLIKNAPIRYKILGDFNEAWLRYIAEKGDTLKLSEIYPEGRRMAANFQISDEEAERQEVEMNKRLREREATVYPKMPTDKKILEAAKKVAGEKPTLSEPKTIEEFESTVSSIEDEEEAKEYYEKWKNKW